MRIPRVILPARAFAVAFAVACVLASVLACGRGSRAAPDVVRTDSAGVRLITSGARDTVLPWTFKEIDVLRDSLGAPWLFTNVSGSTLMADRAGRTYVITGDPALVRFDRAGRFDRALGRKGGGPGEFQFPTAVGAHGDTIVVRDHGKRSLVRFLPDLTPTADRRLDGALARAEVLAFRTGGLWFRETVHGDSMQVTSVRSDTIGSAPLRSVTVRRSAAATFECVALPGPIPVFAPVTMHAHVARLLVNAQPSYELWLYEGPRAIASIRRPLVPRASTEADVRGLFPDGMKVRFAGADTECIVPVEEVVKSLGLTSQHPFVFDVMLLPDGTMWALRTPHAVRPAVVDVFNSEGVYAGTTTGMGLPLAMMPNGELLFARDDDERGGVVVVRMKGTR